MSKDNSRTKHGGQEDIALPLLFREPDHGDVDCLGSLSTNISTWLQSIIRKCFGNNRSLELPDSLSRSGHEEEVVGGTQQDLSLSHWWPQEGGEVGGSEVAVVEA